MAGTWRISLGTIVLVLTLASNVDAFNGRFGLWPSASRNTSYYSAPVYYYYCPPDVRVVPVPDARPGYATPTPAPPSGEPPLGASDSRLPKITTTRSLDSALSSTKDRCRVGFWNLSGHDVMVTVEGKAWSLPKNQVLRFDIERQFTWQVAGQSQHVERVPDGQGVHEVIIRE